MYANNVNTSSASNNYEYSDDHIKSLGEIARNLSENGQFIPEVYCSKEEIREALLGYEKKFNVVLSIKSSIAYTVVWICKHSGDYRVMDREESATKRLKKSQKIGCGCYVKVKTNKLGHWLINEWEGRHNHPIFKSRSIYSQYRIQPEEIEERIGNMFKAGLSPSSIFIVLQSENIKNITKKDLENKYFHFFDLKRKIYV
ncbi:hypothetical protein G6F70_008092 [Rhizopus microsporus]|uniref:FAR1 domain-containing protein n=2 Tax=Rhizopus TaxID=4842 RepID=A0A367JQG1_RHIAZ|nr:hypothetical protein G6F71_008089 [Rhizopus microsporus]RCH92192.1 hypothetical protein CU097_006619 [Rhizopus azygosporus]KAG1195626.1 hypothetical protein G6F70_008092 [Rhizopus microsporus]KAG1207461.1 hypothetical protein G6F69_008030 [Rhizopus microsporus]KAG1228263.1 hypothetical protein G6F67_007937 [Rhizopus microsporus]